ncbi:MAG: AAA family ATPase [Puniceicoccales bacterium]|jgi:RecA-family ATPase|nr:AAA family ATPase [Puniceicoccales bacterium]
MSTDDTDNNESKIDYTINFDPNARAVKPIEEHPLFHLAKEKEPSCDRQENALTGIYKTTMDDESFFMKDISPRRAILGSWFREGSLGFIFGRRGAGKTWFAWDMAISISKGINYGPWKCEMPRKTLYVDGEMPLRSMQERLKLLNPNPTGNLFIMSRERLMDEARMLLNLCESCWQEALLTYCIEEKIKVVFLDNLSSLCWGMKENEADSWEQVLSWLLMLRQSGIAIIIVHHANRDGNEMRGTSRREDAADWVIKVSPNFKFAKIDKGTAFTTTFTKNREDNGDHEESMDWTFITEDGKTNVNWKRTDLVEQVYEMIKEGAEYCSDIAEGFNRSKMEICRCAKKLQDMGFIKKEGQRYVLAEYNVVEITPPK